MRRRCALVRMSAVAVSAVVVVACGGAEDPPAGGGSEAGSGPDTSEEAPQEPAVGEGPGFDEPDGGSVQEGSVDQGSAAGPTEHRPAEGFSPDCSAFDGDAPGASLVFPDEGDPAWGGAGVSPVTVEFVGCADTYEANVAYEAFHGEDRRPTLSGSTMGGTLGDWAEFRFEETFWTPGEWRVELVEVDAEDGERRVHDEIRFTVDPR
jgi:hypothetical protein